MFFGAIFYEVHVNRNHLIYFRKIHEINMKMNRERFTIGITAGITVILLLIGGTGATTVLLNTAHAQTATLGEPYFVERGKSTGQNEIGPNMNTIHFYR